MTTYPTRPIDRLDWLGTRGTVSRSTLQIATPSSPDQIRTVDMLSLYKHGVRIRVTKHRARQPRMPTL